MGRERVCAAELLPEQCGTTLALPLMQAVQDRRIGGSADRQHFAPLNMRARFQTVFGPGPIRLTGAYLYQAVVG